MKVKCRVGEHEVMAVPGQEFTFGTGGTQWGPVPVCEMLEDGDYNGIAYAVPLEIQGGGERMGNGNVLDISGLDVVSALAQAMELINQGLDVKVMKGGQLLITLHTPVVDEFSYMGITPYTLNK